jgi:hypothetical protein
LTFIPESITKLLGFLGAVIIIALLILNIIYGERISIKLNFKYEISFLLLAVFISMFMAKIFHGQSIPTTLLVQRSMYYLLFYFLLAYLKLDKYELMRIIVYFAIVYFLIYLIQYSIYPSKIFRGRASLDRGTVRIFLPGYIYLLSAFFIGLFQFYNFNKLKYGAICGMVAIILVLQGTRQSMATAGLLTVVSIIFSKQAKSKFLYMFLIVISVIPIFILFQDIFMNLLEVTQHEQGQSADNVRIRSATFFLTTFMPDKLAYFLGNGASSANEEYGQLMEMYAELYGFYRSDVGIIGTYVTYGAIFAIAELAIYFKVLRKKLPENISFIKYVFFFNLLTILTGSDSFGGMDGIIGYSILLYLIDISLAEEKKASYNI